MSFLSPGGMASNAGRSVPHMPPLPSRRRQQQLPWTLPPPRQWLPLAAATGYCPAAAAVCRQGGSL